MGKTCCFSGHRILPAEALAAVAARTEAAILSAVRAGADVFVAGGALGFDMLAAETVLKLRQAHPEIALHLVLPCRDQADRWPAEQQRRYRAILNAADHVEWIAEAYFNGCMQKRNRAMVDRSDFLICYITHAGGGTDYTVRYALKKGVKTVNVAPPVG